MQFRKLHQNVRHFVAALSAAHVYDDVRVRPFGQLVLYNSFTGAEGAGNRRDAAAGDGEKRVDYTLAGHHRHGWRTLLFIWAAATHRPFLHHGQLVGFPFGIHNFADRIGNGMFPCVDFGDLTGYAIRHHNPMLHHCIFLHHADDCARHHLVAWRHARFEIPADFTIQRGYFHTACNPFANFIAYLGQRPLDSVENGFDQPRPQFHRKWRAGAFYRLAIAQAAGFLVDLYAGTVAAQLDDLPNQTVFTDAYNVVHTRVGHMLRHDQGACDLDDGSLCHALLPFFLVIAEKDVRADCFFHISFHTRHRVTVGTGAARNRDDHNLRVVLIAL